MAVGFIRNARYYLVGNIDASTSPTIATPMKVRVKPYKERRGEFTDETSSNLSTQVDNTATNDVDITEGVFLFSAESPTQRETLYFNDVTKGNDPNGDIYYDLSVVYRGISRNGTTNPPDGTDSFNTNFRKHRDGAVVLFDSEWYLSTGGASAGTGESNTISSLGAGQTLVSGKVGTDLQLKSLTSTDSSISFTDNGDTVDIKSLAANPFLLTIGARDLAQSRVLTWGALPGATLYEVYRDGVQIGTTTATTYTDTDILAMNDYQYEVRAQITDDKAKVGTQNVYASVDSFDLTTFRGDGTDGSFAGGTLAANQTYNFTDINLTGNMFISGNIILVQGDVSLNGFSIISVLSDGTSSQSVMVSGTSYDLSQSPLTIAQGGGGVGGFGGNAAPDRASAGEDGAISLNNGTAFGGAGGVAPTSPSYEGQDGGNGTVTSTTGAGGGGGSHGWGHDKTVILLGGNWNDTGSNIVGVGSDGGDGGNGAAGFASVVGSGGGAGQGGDGLTMYIKVDGTTTTSNTSNLIGGSGGAGGSGSGLGGPGQDGTDGADGTINFI